MERLRGERRAVVVLRAPAGYGKTTAVAQWLRDTAGAERSQRVWVSLDQDDDSTEGLWAAIAASAAAEGLRPDQGVDASRPGGVRAGTIVPLLDAFATSAGTWTLVLDDAHLVQHEGALASLDWFIGRAPENLTTVVVTRTPLELPALGRLRARGRAIELGIDELRLDGPQIVHLLVESDGLDLAPEDVSRITEVTGGWPAAVSLIGSALAHGVPLSSAGARRAGRDGLDALVREGLAGNAPDDYALLRMLSIFERFDATTVDAVIRDARAWPLALSVAERTGLIASLDDDGRWWRMHQLVRERLAAELQREDPGLRRELHRRAAAVFEPEHDLTVTMHHLFGAEDYETVADILSNVRANSVVPRQSLGLSWLDRIPDSALDRDPRLAFWEAWATATGGDVGRRDRALARGRLAAGERAVDAFRTWDDVEDFVHSMACYDDVGAARRAGERFLSSYDESSPLTQLVVLRLATMLYLAGRSVEALDLLEALDRGAPLARPLRVLVPAYRALCSFELDDTASAAVQVERARQARSAFDIGSDPVYLSAEQALARHQSETGDPDGARTTVLNALETARQQGDAVFAVPSLLVELARAESALGNRAEALVALAQADELVTAAVDAGAVPDRIAALRMRLHATPRPHGPREGLTRRELEVLALLSTSLSASEIASELFISANTARSHIKAIHQKLGATTRGEAVSAARRAGLIR